MLLCQFMIDSHCHIDSCKNDDAVDPSLNAMVTIGTSLERSINSLKIAKEHKNVWLAVGIHPNNASDAKDKDIRQGIEQLATNELVVGIGETGFDNYWDDETFETQIEAFRWQAELAKKLDKALILHIRDKQGKEDASLLAMQMIKESGLSRGILHCFNGHKGLLELGLEQNWMISFAGNVTYKKATELHEAAKIVPKTNLMVETDSPYLAPVPKRGKRNTPGYVRHTAAFLAKLRGESLEELESYTDTNAIKIYKLPI